MSLSFRIAAGLMLLVLAALALPGYLIWAGVRERGAAAERAAAEDLHLAVAEERRRLERTVDLTVDRLGLELAGSADLTARFLGRPPGPATGEAAAHVMTTAGLDALRLIGSDGIVVACGHWPALAGSPANDLIVAPATGPFVRWERVRNEVWPTLQASRAVSMGGRKVVVVGGVRLDRVVKERPPARPDASLALVDSGGSILAAGAPPFALVSIPAGVAHELAVNGSFTGVELSEKGESWLVSGTTFTALPGESISLVAASSLEPLRAGERRLIRILAAAALSALGAAALGGILLGRRIARPLRDLTGVAGRIAAGDLELDLAPRSKDEIGALTTAFASMAAGLRAGQAELARSERLAAWRDAARRMAHEVKNPLTPIRMAVENLKRAHDIAPERFEALLENECGAILEEVDALRRLVDEFSLFARLPEPAVRSVDPVAIVRHVEELFRPGLDGVALDLDLTQAPPRADLDPDLVGQVLKNLVGNALDAVPRPGGRITLRCQAQNASIDFSVGDNGSGIPAEVKARLFEPQSSAKPSGTGLGLAICRQIVERLGGQIEAAEREPGTMFTVTLPIHSAPAPLRSRDDRHAWHAS